MGSERETAVIEAAQGGDQRAQDELVAAYLPLVYNIVGRALSGHADVDDVVQETLIRALSGLGTLRDPGSFRSWLVAITMNQIRDHWQSHRTAPVSGELPDARDMADPGADFVDLTILRLGLSGQRREVAEATRWLDADDRALLSLWWLEAAGELTRAEVAAAMELSPQHTAVRIQRVKAQLETARVVVRALSAEPRCALLGDAIVPWGGDPSTLWRKRLARHARDCTVCSGYGAGLVPAERLLVGLGLLPVSAALADAVAPGGHDSPALAAYGDDLPVQLASSGRRQERVSRRAIRRRRAVAASAAVLLVGGGAYAGLTLLKPDEARKVAPAQAAVGAAVPTAAPSTKSPSPKASASPSKAPSASATPVKKTAKAKPRPKPKPAPSKAPPRPVSTPDPRPSAQPGAAPSSFAQQVTALVNTERRKSGCAPVTQNARLDTAGQRHSEDMAARDYFDHSDPDGRGPGERVTAAGYTWSTYGENIARGQQTPGLVMQGWMDSPGHRANILNCSFKEIGLGVHDASGGPWWTQVFGAR
ncbi:sigma-70 family RNA polymerase sigma factor [Streptomyces sp. 21So2-11]|uniref:sigma-70 family RNA polymerase sigma factor n=1 Tax=Streptomyces sp. 21So2-11 TaxID=3144408 RepID=UPI003218FB94